MDYENDFDEAEGDTGFAGQDDDTEDSEDENFDIGAPGSECVSGFFYGKNEKKKDRLETKQRLSTRVYCSFFSLPPPCGFLCSSSVVFIC